MAPGASDDCEEDAGVGASNSSIGCEDAVDGSSSASLSLMGA